MPSLSDPLPKLDHLRSFSGKKILLLETLHNALENDSASFEILAVCCRNFCTTFEGKPPFLKVRPHKWLVKFIFAIIDLLDMSTNRNSGGLIIFSPCLTHRPQHMQVFCLEYKSKFRSLEIANKMDAKYSKRINCMRKCRMQNRCTQTYYSTPKKIEMCIQCIQDGLMMFLYISPDLFRRFL